MSDDIDLSQLSARLDQAKRIMLEAEEYEMLLAQIADASNISLKLSCNQIRVENLPALTPAISLRDCLTRAFKEELAKKGEELAKMFSSLPDQETMQNESEPKV